MCAFSNQKLSKNRWGMGKGSSAENLTELFRILFRYLNIPYTFQECQIHQNRKMDGMQGYGICCTPSPTYKNTWTFIHRHQTTFLGHSLHVEHIVSCLAVGTILPCSISTGGDIKGRQFQACVRQSQLKYTIYRRAAIIYGNGQRRAACDCNSQHEVAGLHSERKNGGNEWWQCAAGWRKGGEIVLEP